MTLGPHRSAAPVAPPQVTRLARYVMVGTCISQPDWSTGHASDLAACGCPH